MRDNGPVTQVEHLVPEDGFLVSRTDPHGIITFANDAFVQISGYTREELVGQPHAMVRHPDMPPAAFENLWSNLRAGRCWVGTVKNRCKDGSYYWVRAAVAPTTRNGQVVEYVSVRVRPDEAEKRLAEQAYAALRAGRGGYGLHRGRLRPSGADAVLGRLWQRILGRAAVLAIPGLLFGVAGIVLVLQGSPMPAAACWSMALACAAVAAFGTRAAMLGRIDMLRQDLDRMARGEDVCINLDRADEMQDLVLAVASLQTHLKAASLDLAESHRAMVGRFDTRIGSVIADLNQVVQQLAGASGSQTGLAEEVSACARGLASVTTEMGSSIAEISRQATQADRMAVEARQQTTAGREAANRLAATANEIGDVAKVIAAIAAQTNLLALNATIEAAAAGTYGRGFAVVAGEVKTLAGKAQQATADISKRLAAVQQDATAVHAAMTAISSSSEHLAAAMSSIAAAIEEQTAVAGELTSNSNNLAESARQAGASATAVGTVAANVTQVDEALLKAVQVFRNVA